MEGFEARLSQKQEKGLLALLNTGTVAAAATSSGFGETTLWRWMQESAFITRYRAARRQMVETAIAQLQTDTGVAVRVLREVAEDKEAPASARVAAAKAIIEQAISAVTVTDLQERIEKLEAEQNEPRPKIGAARSRAS